ncbi:hypothetical protein [Aeromonas salmonicida]
MPHLRGFFLAVYPQSDMLQANTGGYLEISYFDQQGFDKESFSPFVLHNCLDTEWKDVRLSFDDWGLFQMIYGSYTVDGYYMNGYGVEGLVKAALFKIRQPNRP